MALYLCLCSLQSQVYPSLEYGVYGVISLAAGLTACLLPETLGVPLPETVDDVTPHRMLTRVATPLKR